MRALFQPAFNGGSPTDAAHAPFYWMNIARFFSIGMALFTVFGYASLVHAVMHIVCIRTQKEMVRPDALSIIAMMADVHIRRNRAMRKVPGNAMRFAFGKTPAPYRWSQISITSSSDATSPFPTSSFAFGYFGPNQVFDFLSLYHMLSIPQYGDL